MWSILANLMLGFFSGFWEKHKQAEADNVPNEVNKLSDAAVDDKLLHWKRPTKPM